MQPEELVNYAKEKGFIFPSSEIYGGLAGLYDYGHNGSVLKRKFEDVWRGFFLRLHDNFHEIQAASIMHEKVFEASGHLKNFTDPVVQCSKCGFFDRADHFIESHTKARAEGLSIEEYDKLIRKHKLTCPQCKKALKKTSILNLMYPITLGVGKGQQAYLRPETAQSPYVDFKTQYKLLREKIPLGLALIGKAYRNEISPRNLTLRQREFTQAELQIFFNPEKMDEWEDFAKVQKRKVLVTLEKERKKEVTEKTLSSLKFPKMYLYFLAKMQEFFVDELKIPKENFRLYQLNDKEKAFYNKFHFDVEVKLNGHEWTEIAGLHYRTDHDLAGHQEVSKEKMEVSEDGKKFVPHVLEVSFGVDRSMYALLDQHVKEDKRGNLVLHLPPKVSPVSFSVFPLVNKNHAKAYKLYTELRKKVLDCSYDKSGSLGRRYARADEIGTPLCITVDFDKGVTLRDRETTKQVRVKEDEVLEKVHAFFSGDKFSTLGKIL